MSLFILNKDAFCYNHFMEYIPVVITVAVVHLLAVMSPGPDFVMVTRNSLVYSRKTGIYSAIGLGLGILVHVIYSLVGIGIIISQSVVLFNIIKFIGAAYLIYIGYKSLTSKTSYLNTKDSMQKKDISQWKAINTGFLTNVLNPKATLFFLSLFTIVISPETPLFVKIFMGVEMAIATALWFALVAFLISNHHVKSKIQKVQGKAEKVIGFILIGLGVKVALSSNN
jgi:RhtB (resistance to homoserine/threonine) family protein